MAIASGYWSTWGATANHSIGASTSREILVQAHHARVRQSDWAIGARLFVGDVTGLTAIYIKVWRPNNAAGSTFRLVGQSNNQISFISPGTVNDLYFTAPFGILEGDYVAVRMEGSANGVNQLVLEASSDAQILEITNSVPSASAADWLGASATSGLLKVQLLTPSCKVAWLGHSIWVGSTAHKSFCQVTPPEDDLSLTATTGTIPYFFGRLSPAPYQNLGVGGQTANALRTRFVQDVLASGAECVMFNAGGGDVLSAVSQATFIAEMTIMLDWCVQFDLSAIVMAILPGSAFTDAQCVTRDAFNVALRSLVTGYKNARFVDPSARVGQARASGPAGNTWDQQTQFNVGDGLHYTAAANRIIAHVLHAELARTTPQLVQGSVAR